MLEVDKLCALRFITLINACDCNSSNYKREGSSFITSELRDFYHLYSPELIAASLVKFTISQLGFEQSPGCEKFESQNFKKIKFLHLCFIFVTYLQRKVDGRVISEIYFLDKN